MRLFAIHKHTSSPTGSSDSRLSSVGSCPAVATLKNLDMALSARRKYVWRSARQTRCTFVCPFILSKIIQTVWIIFAILFRTIISFIVRYNNDIISVWFVFSVSCWLLTGFQSTMLAHTKGKIVPGGKSTSHKTMFRGYICFPRDFGANPGP